MCRCSVMLKNFSGSSHNGVGERTGNPSESDTVKSIPLATLAEKALTFSYSLKKKKKKSKPENLLTMASVQLSLFYQQGIDYNLLIYMSNLDLEFTRQPVQVEKYIVPQQHTKHQFSFSGKENFYKLISHCCFRHLCALMLLYKWLPEELAFSTPTWPDKKT